MLHSTVKRGAHGTARPLTYHFETTHSDGLKQVAAQKRGRAGPPRIAALDVWLLTHQTPAVSVRDVGRHREVRARRRWTTQTWSSSQNQNTPPPMCRMNMQLQLCYCFKFVNSNMQSLSATENKSLHTLPEASWHIHWVAPAALEQSAASTVVPETTGTTVAAAAAMTAVAATALFSAAENRAPGDTTSRSPTALLYTICTSAGDRTWTPPPRVVIRSAHVFRLRIRQPRVHIAFACTLRRLPANDGRCRRGPRCGSRVSRTVSAWTRPHSACCCPACHGFGKAFEIAFVPPSSPAAHWVASVPGDSHSFENWDNTRLSLTLCGASLK